MAINLCVGAGFFEYYSNPESGDAQYQGRFYMDYTNNQTRVDITSNGLVLTILQLYEQVGPDANYDLVP